MGQPKDTQYADKKCPGGKLTNWKPSKQPCKKRIVTLLNPVFTTVEGTNFGYRQLQVDNTLAELEAAYGYTPTGVDLGELIIRITYNGRTDQMASFLIGSGAPGHRALMVLDDMNHVHWGDPLVATLMIFEDGFDFDEITYAHCAICGVNIAHRKKNLRYHPITGQFVCADDYDKLGMVQLEQENQYRAGAVVRLGDDFASKSEWP
jgi:hypothetical protein